MARARNIKPSFFTNEIIGTLDPIIGMAFIGLWCLADKEGRLEDRPLRIKAELFPYRDGMDVNGYLTVLEREGFIDRYEVDGVRYIQIINFEKHQSPHHTEKAKGLPPKPKNAKASSDLTVKPPLDDRKSQVPTRSDSLIPDSLIPDKKTSAAKATRFDPLSIDLGCIPVEAWNRWIAYRRSRRLTNTEATVTAQVASLNAWAAEGSPPESVIDTSIEKGWQGLFKPKDSQPNAPPRMSASDASKLAAARTIFGTEIEGNGHGNIINGTARSLGREDFQGIAGQLRQPVPEPVEDRAACG